MNRLLLCRRVSFHGKLRLPEHVLAQVMIQGGTGEIRDVCADPVGDDIGEITRHNAAHSATSIFMDRVLFMQPSPPGL